MAAEFGEARDRFNNPSEESSTWNRASEQVNKVTDTVAEMGQKASARMEEQRLRAASALETTASTLHQQADSLPRAGDKIANIAHRTAAKLENTAGYLKDHDARAMYRDVEDLVKRYPGQFLAAGLVLGFFIGRGLRRSDF